MVQNFAEIVEDCFCVPDARAVSSLIQESPQGPVTIWGKSPHDPIHLAYDALIVRQKQLVALGCQHVVLLADFHAMMTHGIDKAEVSARASYWQNYLKLCCGLEAKFVWGSDFEARIDYIEQLFSLMSGAPVSVVKNAFPAAERQNIGTDASKVSAFLYAIMQCLDASYLGADLVFAEIGQKKIYDLIGELHKRRGPSTLEFAPMPSIGAKCDVFPSVRNFMYMPVGHDIKGKRLVESKSSTRISIHETRSSLEQKVQGMYAPPTGQEVAEGCVNALLEHFQYSVFPWVSDGVEIKGEDGHAHRFYTYQEFTSAYQSGQIYPNECKKSMTKVLWPRLNSIQETLGRALTNWVDMERVTGIKRG